MAAKESALNSVLEQNSRRFLAFAATKKPPWREPLTLGGGEGKAEKRRLSKRIGRGCRPRGPDSIRASSGKKIRPGASSGLVRPVDS